MTGRNQQRSWFGNDQAVEPPDTQLAAGPYDLLEMVNSSGSIWAKDNGRPPVVVDLNVLYGVASTPYAITDPRLQYDFATGRWFASALAFAPTTSSSRVYLAVSETFDPSGTWFVYQISPSTSGVVEDQPSLGLTTDKVVLSWNDFRTGTSTFEGQETWVVQKSDVLGGLAPSEVVYGPDASRFSLIGAQQESPTATAFLAYNGTQLAPSSPFIGVVAITGTPVQGNVVWNEQDLAMVATSAPPPAQQPPTGAGNSDLIATNDDRFTSVAWADGLLWAAGNDSCWPAGDTTPRSCLKLVKVSTAAMTVQADIDGNGPGSYMYFPAVAMDPSGNMIVAYTQSSTTQFPSVEATGGLAGDIPPSPTLFPETQVIAGQAVYHCNDNCQIGANGDRWGDYSAAALEPCGSAAVWVAGEYMGDSTDPTDWGTAAGQVLISGSQPPPFEACAWEDHGGILAAGIAASTWGPKRLDAFVRGTDGVLYHRFSDDFSDWQWDPYLPKIVATSDASSVSTAAGSIDVFVRGSDGGLWRTTYRAGTTSGTWQRLGGVLASGTAPSAVSLGSGDIDVFVEGADRQLWDDRYTSATDSWTWTGHGGVLATTPSAISPSPGNADAIVEGTDSALWLWSATGWVGHGGRLAARPVAASSSTGTIDALVEGTDSVLYHWSSAITSNAGWETVGGRLAAAPAATSWGGGRIDVLVRGADSALWRAWTTNGQGPWSWQGNGGKIVGAPAAITYAANRLDVFVRGLDNHLWHLPFD